MTTQITQTYVQHADDLSRDISNAVLEWQRRNPGKTVARIEFDFMVHDILAPHALLKVHIIDRTPTSPGYVDRENGEGERAIVSKPPLTEPPVEPGDT